MLIIGWTATVAATPSGVAIFLSGGQAGGSADGGEPGRMAVRLTVRDIGGGSRDRPDLLPRG
jgi:hypothetical protein